MAHFQNLRWSTIESLLTNKGRSVINTLSEVEQLWTDMQALWVDAGGTDELVAERLFGVPGAATAEQIAMVADAKAAMQAMNELATALNNGVVAQDDRRTKLGRFI